MLGLSGAEAIAWIRRYIPGAVETWAQRQLVLGVKKVSSGSEAER